ncbi:hypothetical protein HNR46_000643 [Haloferula luteola]|uniref:Cytochrome c domain-containing protein n=1 Tax=Haloferula luteola TaxID=595692 RepID=A0A840V9F8_9BACT|nr:PVC-type heme-binding CxxCH protein [Haloferula luteola]MBB5350419.1 hypothetical protein [Haloferula luteola]
MRTPCSWAALWLVVQLGAGLCDGSPVVRVQAPKGLFESETHVTELPNASELGELSVILSSQAGGWSDARRREIDAWVQQGGGLVLVNEAVPASGFLKGEIQRWEGSLPWFFTPEGRDHPISTGISNFDGEDEMFYGFVPPQQATVLATTWTPNSKHLKGTTPQPYVYGVSPVLWTMEWGKGRVVVFTPGKREKTLELPAVKVMLQRALNWAGRLEGDETVTVGPVEAEDLMYPQGGPLSPTEELKAIEVHPEFDLDLVASEPLISKPLNLDWDAQGRLWVVESVEYPEGREGGGAEGMYSVWQRDSDLPRPAPAERPPLDRVSWLEDGDGDGVMDRKHVFAEGFDLATSFCFYRDGIIVAQPPQVLWVRDRDGDGVADNREVLYDGLGTFDRHAVLNNLRWGLDGWVYATHGYSGSPRVTSGDGTKDFGAINSGVVRFRPDGSKIEMYSAKSGNCWGVDLSSDGEIFYTQPTSGDLVMHVPVSDALMAAGGLGREPSYQVMVHLRPVKPLMSWEEIVENQPNDVIGSFTAACGCAVYEGGAWPDSWSRGYFTCEPTVHIVHHEQLTPDGVTYAAEKTREEEFAATRDFWSRPIDSRIGPDGQLYVIDFYNQAILHNDPRGPIHLWNNQAARPDRDHYFGRIHRYHHKDSKALPKADLTTLRGQVAALSHPNREVRYRAQRLLEEGDTASAAGMLKDARGVAAIHALWIRAAAGVLSEEEWATAMVKGNEALRVSAARVMGEYPQRVGRVMIQRISEHFPEEESARVRLQILAHLPLSAKVPVEVLVSAVKRSPDRWTRAAAARLARQYPAETLVGILQDPEPERLVDWSGLVLDAGAEDPERLAEMLEVLAAATQGDWVASALESLRGKELKSDPRVLKALKPLAESSDAATAAAGIAMMARMQGDEHGLKRAIESVLARGSDNPRVLAPLVTLPDLPDALRAPVLKGVAISEEMRAAVLPALAGNASSKAARWMIELLAQVPAQEKAVLLESLLARREGAMALTKALDDGSLPLAVVGPQVLSRLAEHPDVEVRHLSSPVVERLRGAVVAKDEVIRKLLPEVSQPGDREVGHQLFAACAVCHVFQGEGVQVGPMLEGIGVHGVETLLTHIVDPNREVEPSYHTWNLKTTDGRVISGFISRETAESLFLRNAGGEVEVRRNEIASREDTGRSLMPEGFEGLGAEALRNLITYLRSGEQRFQTVSLARVATADGSRGVYASKDTEGDRVPLKRYGLVEVEGIPFQLEDPALSPTGKNLIVLRGGMNLEALSQGMPDRVEIPIGGKAGRLHLLGAVAGWGYPAFQERVRLVTIEVEYEDGDQEEIRLVNGIDISDHVAGPDVPGSVRVDEVEQGQIRYLWRDLKSPEKSIRRLVISSSGAAAAPMIAGITLEAPAKDGVMAPPPNHGGAASENTTH